MLEVRRVVDPGVSTTTFGSAPAPGGAVAGAREEVAG